ncbi:hypothetical protein FHL15_002567 [Xylaria flabelliformis]|uniref:G-patch domain-containing protein n=1 Tax=Xylaria flabelliformis TaxID=2512241 RepID=A0A553I8Y1_9PEZI|nr:hypothetical protein FHL15_002567 [Xylaria flabelliformis]
MANIPDEADINFRREVINQLVNSVDCTEHLKTSFRQFLGNITADVKHKDLAYHLFLTTTLYISKKVVLDGEQMSVICRTVEQLRQEWSNEGASSELSSTISHTRVSEHDMHPSPFSDAPSLRVEPEDAITPAASKVAEGDVGSMCDTLERIRFSRSTTPASFVREAEKHVLVAPNFHEAIQPEDTADLSSQYPYGYRLMRKQGWSNRSGLGPDGSGIQRPIDASALASFLGDNESLTDMEFASKSSSPAPTNGIIAGKLEKRTNKVAAGVSPWRQYAADPYTGDISAKNGYGNNDRISTAQPNTLLQGVTTETDGNTNTIDRDQCVIKDVWKDTSKHKSTRHIQKNATPPGSSWGVTNAPPENTNVFVPCTSTFGGW